jgi:hypothetical protein
MARMENRLSPHDALEAWQAGEITFRRCMRLTGIDDLPELYAAAKSSGVDIRGVSQRDYALADRAARILSRRLDTVKFWKRADEKFKQPSG